MEGATTPAAWSRETRVADDDDDDDRAVSLPQHGFLVGLCLQTAVNYLSKSDMAYKYTKRISQQIAYLTQTASETEALALPVRELEQFAMWPANT